MSAIGAGGGSLVTIGQTGEIQVGPGSAGSNPGPACYGRGGTEPTTTDTCVLIGILDPERFAGGELRLDADLAREAFERLDSEFTLGQRVRYAYEMAVHTIAEGVFNVAIKNGVDPRDYTLMAYGSAGPMLLPAAMDVVHCKQCINSGITDAKTALGVALTMLLDPKIPFTSGTWRNVDLAAPAGTLVTAMPPEGAPMMFWESSGALIAAIFRALNPVLGENAVGGDYGSTNTHNANGVRADGTRWTSATQCGGEHGPWGATKDGDGDSYTVLFNLNNLDPATETIEHDSPVVVLRKEHAIDTGGAGRFRGGAANLKDTLWLTDADQYLSPFRTKDPSGVGANGGVAGPNGAMWIFPPAGDEQRTGLVGTGADVYAPSTPVAGVLDPETKALDPEHGTYHYFASQKTWKTTAGAVLRCLTNGGGGWGAPFERDPQNVLADVRDEYVSVEGAARDYGVVVLGDPHRDPEGLRVDEQATIRLRGAH